MYKIVILGCENSHADSFLEFVKDDREFSDVEVIGIYSNDAEAAKSLSERFGVAVMERYDEKVSEVDGVMVTARDGKYHLEYVKPYLEKGIPVFMDKPITIKPEDAKEMISCFLKFGNKFTGGSSLKHCEVVKRMKEAHENAENSDAKTIGGVVRAPLDPKNPYGDFYFYAQHLVEIVCEVFGAFPKSIIAKEKEKHISVLFRYDNFDITGFYGAHSGHYYISRFLLNDTQSEKIVLDKSVFREEFYQFYRLLKGDLGKIDAKRFIAPVLIMNAIESSLKNNSEEFINW